MQTEKPSTDAALISWPEGARAWGVGGWAIATLPVILYYHDDFARLSDRLRQSVAALDLSSSDEDDSMAALQVWGGCISLALRGDRPSVGWLGQLSLELNLPQRSPHLAQQLAQVQDWLAGRGPSAQPERSRSESAVGNHDPSRAIALALFAPALYSVLSTPDSVRLSLAQAAALGDPSGNASATVCALTGALSGSVNSVRGIPLQWRQGLWADPTATSPVAERWGLPSEAALLDLADRLAAHWSGLYDLESPIEPRAIALAPDRIRPRPARISV
ncbi:MAG TPA: ADP-ribosylglycohydrolase family protein [Chroococcidiopsis sp.]